MFHEVVKGLLAERGMTQRELAKAVGITDVGMCKALSGKTTVATLKKVAAVLGVEVVDLFKKEKAGL